MEALYGQRMPLPDERYEQVRDRLQGLRQRAAANEIEKALRQLWAFDERFFGEVLGFSYDWAVYSLCYLCKDGAVIRHLLNIYVPLLGRYIQETLGADFRAKVGSTFMDDVGHILWDVEGLIEPEDHGPFDWHGNRNDLSLRQIEAFLQFADLPPLPNPDFPPRRVLLHFTNLQDPFDTKAQNQRDLQEFYWERSYPVELQVCFQDGVSMNNDGLFCHLSSARIADLIRAAQSSVCYAGPGIQVEPAKAMAEVAGRIGPELLTVSLDFDERVMRMGYGDIAAVQVLRDAGIVINNSPGLRSALIIVDGGGYTFTPTPLYLEADSTSDSDRNAVRLSPEQVAEALARLSPAAKAIAMARTDDPEEKTRIASLPVEVGATQVDENQFKQVDENLKEAPPVRFDLARQVRVFEPYLQYVELSLTGAAIQRHRLAIPASIQKLGGSKDLEGRLRTTFDLIEKSGKLSSKKLEEELNKIRKDFAKSLGKNHGRVVLKNQKATFEERLETFKSTLNAHQKTVADELNGQLEESRNQIIDYYL